MIYNENGIIINNHAFYENDIDLNSFNILLESISDEEQRENLKQLKELMKECDKESLSKIKSIDKKYKYLSEKVRNVLDTLNAISSGGLFASLIASGVAINKNNNLAIKITLSILGFFVASFVTLYNIVKKSDSNKPKYCEEMINLSKDVIDRLKKISNDNKLPKEVREKAKENIEKIKDIVDYKLKGKEKSKYINFKINNLPITLAMNSRKYENNKSFYDNALKSFSSKFNSEMKRIKKELEDFGEGYEDYADGSITKLELDDNYYGSAVYDSDDLYNEDNNSKDAFCACLYISLSNSKDKSNDCIQIHMIYTKSEGYYTCGWDALG